MLATPLLLAPAHCAYAEPESIAVQEAKRHYQAGVNFYNDGDYRFALIEFEKAYELDKNVRLLYNIGQVRYQLNQYGKALRAFRQYLDEGGATIPEERRKAVETDITALKSRVARLSITSSNAPGSEIRIDDEVIGTTPVKDAFVDIGAHTLIVSHDGFKPKSKQITLAGQDVREIDVPLQKEEARLIVERSNGIPAQVWIGWSVTAALGVGTLTGALLTHSATNDITAYGHTSNQTSAGLKSLGDKRDHLQLLTYVLGGATVAAAGVSLYFTIAASKANSRANQAAPAAPQALLRVRPSLGGLVFDGTF